MWEISVSGDDFIFISIHKEREGVKLASKYITEITFNGITNG